MAGTQVYMIDLDKALQQNGCPICNIGIIAEHRHIGFFLHENVNDGQARADLLRSWGFCNLHAWRLQEFEQREYQDGSKNAIIYESMLARAVKIAQMASTRLDNNLQTSGFFPRPKPVGISDLFSPSQACPICIVTRDAQRFNLNLLVQNLADPGFLARYQAGDGLCLPHFAEALDLPQEKNLLQKLCALQIERMSELHQRLTSYIDKHEYRNRESYTREESSAWIKAVALMAGNKSREWA